MWWLWLVIGVIIAIFGLTILSAIIVGRTLENYHYDDEERYLNDISKTEEEQEIKKE
jgi:hypothetical protein